jgi:Na+-transporting methylmalonyl-CoA/oxaloacetate decarboxylase gamma subunit
VPLLLLRSTRSRWCVECFVLVPHLIILAIRVVPRDVSRNFKRERATRAPTTASAATAADAACRRVEAKPVTELIVAISSTTLPRAEQVLH